MHKCKNLYTRGEPAIFSHVGDIKGGKDLIVHVHTEGQNSKRNEGLVPCRQRTTHTKVLSMFGFEFPFANYVHVYHACMSKIPAFQAMKSCVGPGNETVTASIFV